MYAVIQYVLGGVIRHEIISERDIADEIDGRPIWRGSVVAWAEDHRGAGLLADYHVDLAEQGRKESFARSVVDGRLWIDSLRRKGLFQIAMEDASGFHGPEGVVAFRAWWQRLACHCTSDNGFGLYLCVPDHGYHRHDCPIYGDVTR